MRIIVNGNEQEAPDGAMLVDLLPGNRQGTAVAVNDSIVPRHGIEQVPVTDGDRIEIVTAVQGG